MTPNSIFTMGFEILVTSGITGATGFWGGVACKIAVPEQIIRSTAEYAQRTSLFLFINFFK
jgi:hypothetical protein